MRPRPSKRRLLALLALTALVAGAALLARPAFHLARTVSHDTGARAPLPPGFTDDASRLNQTKVAEIWRPEGAATDPERELAALLAQARADGLRVSIAGARHTMGGHTIYPGGVVVDMSGWNSMRLDGARGILKVGAGALWSDVIPYLDARGMSVAVMQSNNSFSVGGSISVNCHGWQYDRPPIASTVESFRLMLADGSVVRCSRSENAELFSLALGGYGLFGIILDAELRVVPNERYRLVRRVVPIDDSLATLDEMIESLPGAQMVYARMSIVPESLFDEVILNAFVRDADDAEGGIPTLTEGSMADLQRAVFRGSAESDYGKELRWKAETQLQPLVAGSVASRNQLLNEGVEVFENRSADSTDILHEYFVPRRRAAGFVGAMRSIIGSHRPNLMNVTVRGVNRDDDTFLRYADEDMIAFVMLFVQRKTPEGEAEMEALTQELVEAALAHEGRHYLPYRLHATPEQFARAYPQAREFFALKQKYDPDELFQNQLYIRYGAPASSQLRVGSESDQPGSNP
jgi:FAD/FMN-containing dehydrogenase